MRIAIDDCMGMKASRLAAGLIAIHKPPIEAYFLEDYLEKRGVHDADWAEVLKNDGEWCVISCDQGKARGQKARSKGPPLHLILPAKEITGFFLGGKMAQVSGFEKARAVLYLFPEIWRNAQNAQRGTRFRISPSGTGYKIQEWPITSTLSSGPAANASPPPSELFPDVASPSEPSP